MIGILILFLMAVVIPVFVGSSRLAVLGFALQSLLSGLILVTHREPMTMSLAVQLIDLCLIRGVVVPWAVIRTLKRTTSPSEAISLVPENLIFWIAAVLVILLGYGFGNAVFPSEFVNGFQLGTAGTAMLIGLFILSSQSKPEGQLIGVLFLESGITAFEIIHEHQPELTIALAIAAVFLLSIFIFLKFLRNFPGFDALADAIGPRDVI